MVSDVNGKVLLVKDNRRGWEFPGGFTGLGEPLTDSAIREVKEESGVDILLTKLLGIEQDIEQSHMVFIYKGSPIGGKLSSSKETKAAGYFTVDEALQMMQLVHSKERLLRCMNEKEIPFSIEIGK